jgi:hypothetical protein
MSVRGPLGVTPDGAATIDLRSGRPRAQGMSIPSGRVGLAGLLITSLVICLSASHTAVLLPNSVRLGLPDGLSGLLGRIGINLGLGGTIAAVVLMFASYALALRATRQLSTRSVLITIAVLNVLVFLAPPLFSTDMFSYVAYGKLGATYGFNPYQWGPGAIRLDTLYSYIGSQWVNTPTAYGPLFTALSYPLALLSVAANAVIYKGVAALSSVAIVALVWKAAKLRSMDPVKAVALVGLNPIIVIYCVGGGHNDLLMLALLVAGVYVMLLDRRRAGGAMFVAAAAIKLTAGVVLPFALATTPGRSEGSEGKRQVMRGALVAAAAFGGLGLAMFGPWPIYLVSTLHTIQNGGGMHSVSGFILTVLGLGRFAGAAGLVLDAAFAGWFVWLVRRVWIGELDWITASGWATVGLLLTAGLLMPWYVAWVLPLAALSSDRRLWLWAIALTALGLTSL